VDVANAHQPRSVIAYVRYFQHKVWRKGVLDVGRPRSDIWSFQVAVNTHYGARCSVNRVTINRVAAKYRAIPVQSPARVELESSGNGAAGSSPSRVDGGPGRYGR